MPDNVSSRGIEFEIKGASGNAAKSIDRLQASLKKLNTSLSKNSGVSRFSRDMSNLSRSVEKLSDKKIGRFISAIKRLAGEIDTLSEFTFQMQQLSVIDFSNLEKASASIEKITKALNSFKGESKKFNFSDLFSASRITGDGANPVAYLLDTIRVGAIAIGKALGAVVKTAARVAKGIIDAFKKVVSFIVSIPSRIKKAFVSAFESVRNSVTKFASGVKEWFGKSLLMKPLRDAIGSAKDFTKRLLNLSSSLKRIAMYRILRTAIKEVTAAFKDGITNLYGWSNAIGGEFAAKMDMMATSLLYFKNSLGAMAAPLLNTLAPVLDYLIDKVVDLLNVINQLFARLTGATYWTRAIKKATAYGDAVGGAGSAAKEAMKYLAPFDELNVLPDDSGRGGGGGAGGNDYSGMFEQVEQFNTEIANFADAIKTAWEKGDWQGVGEAIGNKLNELVDKVQWHDLGEKVGEKINGLFSSEYWTLKTIEFGDIGSGIADALNGAIETVDWTTIGALVTTKLTALGDVIIGFFSTFSFKDAGEAFNDFFTGMFDELGDWLNNYKDDDFGTKVYEKLKSFFVGADVQSIAESALSTIGTGLGIAAKNLGTFFGSIGTDIKAWFDSEIKGANLQETGSNILTWIGNGLSNIGTWVDTNFITPFVDTLGLKDKWTKVKGVAKTIWGNIKDGFSDLTTWVETDIIEPIRNAWLTGDWTTLFDSKTGIMAKIKQGLPNMAAWVTDNIINPIGRALSGGHMEYDGYTYDWVSNWTNIDSSAISAMVENALNFDVGAWIVDHIVNPVKDQLDADFWKSVFDPIISGAVAAIQSALPNWVKRLFGIEGAPPTAAALKDQIPEADTGIGVTSTPEEYEKRFGLEGFTIDVTGFTDNIPADKKTLPNFEGKIQKAGPGSSYQEAELPASGLIGYAHTSGKYQMADVPAYAQLTKATDLIPDDQRKVDTIAKYTDSDKSLFSGTELNREARTIGVWAQYREGDTSKFSGLHKKKDQRTIGVWAQYLESIDGLTFAQKIINTISNYNKRSFSNNWTTKKYSEIDTTAKFTTIDKSQIGTPTVDVKIRYTNPVNQLTALGGAYYGGTWHDIPQYASGGNPHGSLFLAGEAGPEIVGHVGGRTEVLNQSQLAASISAGVARAINDASFQLRGVATMPTYAEDEDTEEAMYRATMRAMQSLGITGDALNDIEAHIYSGEVYESVRESNRQNTRRTGVNALARGV